MAAHFDELETRDHASREADLFGRLPVFLEQAMANAPGWANWLAGVDPAAVTSRAALAGLPVLRKAELAEFQAKEPPFGGFADPKALQGARLFQSPGPIFEGQAPGSDPWQSARAFFAAGVRAFDLWLGPEGIFCGDETYREVRFGAHATGLRTGPVEWTAGVGWVSDSEKRSGVYGRLGLLMRR